MYTVKRHEFFHIAIKNNWVGPTEEFVDNGVFEDYWDEGHNRVEGYIFYSDDGDVTYTILGENADYEFKRK